MKKQIVVPVAIVMIALLGAFALTAVAQKSPEAPKTIWEMREGGDVNYCKDYILEQKSIYSGLQAQLDEVKDNADKARAIIEDQLNGLGLL